MSLPDHYLARGGDADELDPASFDPPKLREKIEPWLSALFQSEHLSLLLGSGFSTAIALSCGVEPVTMTPADADAPHAEAVLSYAERLAAEAGRGSANIEDQIRAALLLAGGLAVLGDEAADEWRLQLDSVLSSFARSVLVMEEQLGAALETEAGIGARDDLVSFLLSFASRAASRERLNLFTTNYDRLIEYGADLVGMRPLDRFVGGLTPFFRASRLEVDMHYNPPGIRGEPRYLEGVIRLTKLHGSVDWRYHDGRIRRQPLAFGDLGGADIPSAFESLLIYPNPAKDMETLEYPYAELFRDFSAAICRPNSTLVTYGYGFGDDHINRVILDMLTIPSTHLVVISYEDVGGRAERFIQRSGRASQVTVLLGSHLGDLETLVKHYLPKPAIDTVTLRRADLLRRRSPHDAGQSGTE